MSVETHHEWWQPAWFGRNEGGQASDRAFSARMPGYVSKLTYLCLMAFTLVLLLAPQDHFPALKPLHLAQLFAILGIIFYIRDRLRYGGPPASTGISAYTWVAILVLWAVVTVPFSVWPGGSVQKLTGLFLKAVIIFWLLGRVVNTPRRLKATVWVLTLCSIPLALSGVHAFLSGGFAAQAATLGSSRIGGYQASLTANPNNLALMLDMLLPLAFGLIFVTKRASLRTLLVVVSVLDIVAIVSTFSRGGFLGLLTVLIGFAIALWRRGNRLAVALLVVLGLAAIPMLPTSYTHRLSTIVDYHKDPTGSAQARMQDMRLAAGYALRHPVIGTGIGMDPVELNKLGSSTWNEVHDVYLRYVMDLGWPGLALFLLLFYSVLKGCSRARRFAAARRDQRDLFFLSDGLMVSLIAFAVVALFSPAAYQFYFYYFAGLAVAAKTIADHIKADESNAHGQKALEADREVALFRPHG